MRTWAEKGLFIVIAILLVSSPASVEGKELRLGVISNKPDSRIKKYGPLIRHVAQQLEPQGVTGGRVVIAPDVGGMAEKIRTGEVDLLFESAFPTIELNEEAGVLPRFLLEKKGSREYGSVIFVRRESPIHTLDDLKGKTIAFEDPFSTSAYLLPKAELLRNGLSMQPLEEKRGADGSVKFVFAGAEVNQAFYVLRKKTDAGAFSTDDWRDVPQGEKKELRIIHQTSPVLRYLASFSPTLPAELSDAIAGALIRMNDDPAGRAVLQQAEIGRIEPLSGEARKSLAYIRELAGFLRNEKSRRK